MDRASEHLVWFVAGALLGVAGAALWPRREFPTPPSSVGKNEKLARAGRKGIEASGMNRRRFRCATCGLETTKGPMSQHLRSSGHADSEPVG